MKVGRCKLCLEIKSLCKESHIIPDFLYKFLYGDNKEIVFVNNDGAETRYNGEYEANILCEHCDNTIIGRFEDYAARFIQGDLSTKIKSKITASNGKEFLELTDDTNYDYSLYKLFLLSILWRASISSRPFFSKLKLSPEVENDLRLRIVSSKSGAPDEYAIFQFLPPLIQTPAGDRFFGKIYMQTMSPMTLKDDPWNMCEFLIEGMKFIFIVSRPQGIKIEPSVQENKLLFGFMTIEEHHEMVLRPTIGMLRKHRG